MKTKIKRHSRSVISVLLAVCMLVSCMTAGMIMTDAAKVDSGTVGGRDNTITDYFFKGSFDGWTNHYVNGRGEAFINIDTAGTYEFVVVTGGGTQRRANKTFTKTESYNTSQDEANFKIEVTTPGTYTFQTSTMNSGGSVTVSLTFPSGGSTTSTDWRLLDGDFSTSSTKKFTLNSSTGKYQYTQDFSSAGDNYFKIYDVTNEKQYSGDNSTTADYTVAEGDSASLVENATKSFKFRPSASGNYVVTLDTTNNTIVINAAKKYEVACQTPDNGTLSSTASSASAGETVTITATPNTNYTLKSLVLTYDDVDHDVTNSVAGNSYTFTMPAFPVTVKATFTNAKTIYFNNYVTQWSKVFVYTKNTSGEEGNGPTPGQEMTQVGESSIYQIEIPADSTYIVFTGSGGANNKGGEITCNVSTIGNDVPSGANSAYNEYKATNTSSGTSSTGTWSIHQGRSNVYNVTPDETITENTNLYYKGIKATLYDYYTDNEYLGGWLTGITDYRDYACEGLNTNDPFRKYFNSALSDYATANTTTYPLYWGNNKNANNPQDGITLYNFNQNVNNSQFWGANKAITGLTGLTLSDSSIYHYKNDATDQNGAKMVMFDEDWLSRENSTGNPLATILHSTGFPVRKETTDTVYCDASAVTLSSGQSIYAHFWKNSDSSQNVNVEGAKNGNVYTFSVPDGYDRVIFYRGTQSGGPTNGNKTSDITFTAGNKYTLTPTFGYSSAANGGTTTHTYYEYDSTNGKDNAFVTSIDTSSNEANISYYADSAQYVKSENKHDNKGFFPFDYNNIIAGGGSYDVTEVYLKPNSNWTQDNAKFAVYFFGGTSGEKWVDMTKVDGKDYYVCTIPYGNYNKLGFARINPSTDPDANGNYSWDSNIWSKIDDLSIPTDSKVLYTIPDGTWTADPGDDTKWSNGGINVPYTPGSTNGYADTTNHYAHDLGFGMKLEIPFTLNKNGLNEDGTAQTFDFSGDDDLWVFIDDQLVLDLGGAHGRTQGSINFNTMQATASDAGSVDYTSGHTRNGSFSSILNTTANDFNSDHVYTMTIYYTERGMFDSNLKFGFSFHAIRNLYSTEKKVRTKSVNSGFYERTSQSIYEGSGITKFERSYQDEAFNFDHKVSSAETGPYAYPADSFTYSKEKVTWTPSGSTTTDSSVSYTTGNPLAYELDNDEKVNFIGKFTSGDYFNITESQGSNNLYTYTPRLTVYDDTDNSHKTTYPVTNVGNGSYRFQFDEPDTSGMKTVNVRAQFENEMKTHDLTVTKSIGDKTDTDTYFTFCISFETKIGGVSTSYIPYPLYASTNYPSNPINDPMQGHGQINDNGRFSIKAGETITFKGIPEGLNIRLVEDTSEMTNYTYGNMSAIGATATPDTTDPSQPGITMTMGASDVSVTARNNDNTVTAIIRVKYAPSYDDFVKGTNISNEPYKPNGSTFFDTTVNLGVKTYFTDETYKSRTNEQYSMTEKAVMNASDTFNVSISNIGAADKLFIGWYDEDGNRWNNTDATQHNLDAKATKAQNRVFEARFITKPTYRIDYDVPTRLWGKRIYKKFGTVDNSMINDTAIGYDSSRDIDQRYYITSNFVETNIPYEKVFLKNITWEQIENGKTATQYGVSKTVTSNTDTSKNVETTTGTVKYDLYRYEAATVEVTKVKVDMYNDCSNLNTCTAQYECDYGASVNNNETVAVNIPDGYTFHRWKIETLHSLGGVKDGTLVTYDYSKNFNYVAYDNYKVTAEYIPKTCDKDYNPAAALNPSDPYHSSAPVNTTTVINLGQTRSHWNDTTTGEVYVPETGDSTSNRYANYNYDRMFVDLALSYSNGNETKLNTLTDCQVGFKIQYYKNDQWNDWKEVSFSSTMLNDKNRIEYYYGFLNSEANRGSKMRVWPTINGQTSGNWVEFQFNDSLFTAQT